MCHFFLRNWACLTIIQWLIYAALGSCLLANIWVSLSLCFYTHKNKTRNPGWGGGVASYGYGYNSHGVAYADSTERTAWVPCYFETYHDLINAVLLGRRHSFYLRSGSRRLSCMGLTLGYLLVSYPASPLQWWVLIVMASIGYIKDDNVIVLRFPW